MLEAKEKLDYMIRTNQVKYYKIAMSYTKNKDDSFDVLHNAIVKALQNYPKLKMQKYMDTWFCRILINESLMFIKSKNKELILDEVESCSTNDFFDIDTEDKKFLYNAVDKLDGDLKTVVILRYYNDLKIKQIAKIMNANLSTTKSRLYKALSILKDELEAEHYDE